MAVVQRIDLVDLKKKKERDARGGCFSDASKLRLFVTHGGRQVSLIKLANDTLAPLNVISIQNKRYRYSKMNACVCICFLITRPVWQNSPVALFISNRSFNILFSLSIRKVHKLPVMNSAYCPTGLYSHKSI